MRPTLSTFMKKFVEDRGKTTVSMSHDSLASIHLSFGSSVIPSLLGDDLLDLVYL